MAVNVVIALYYYLQWTAILFRSPESPENAETGGGAPASGTPRRFPVPPR